MKTANSGPTDSINRFARDVSQLRTRLDEVMTKARVINESALKKLEEGIAELTETFERNRPARAAVVISAALDLFLKIDGERIKFLHEIDSIGPFPEPPRKYSDLRLHMRENLLKATGFIKD